MAKRNNKRANHKYVSLTGEVRGRTTLRWKTHLGEAFTPSQMKDTHIANIILMLTDQRGKGKIGLQGILKFFKEEAKFRGLNKKFLSGAPYSYKDKENNEWTYVKSKGRPMPVGSNKEYIDLLYEN